MKNNLIAAAIIALTASAIASAEETAKPDEHEIKASAELGFLFKTGNTKSGDIKTGFDIEHNYLQWRNLLNFDLLYKKTETEVEDANGDVKDEFETSDQKWSIDAQTNYTLTKSPQNYLYGNLSYQDDRFSSFDNQSSVSVGWGKQWMKDKVSSLFADIGPGYKRDVIKETGDTETAAIVQAQALYERAINEHVQFKQSLVAKYAVDSDKNSNYKAESSLTTKLIEDLQMKFSFIVEHNTEVADGDDNTDTQTAVTLVYSF
ncbi:DUF481 domain-containing protein [Thalassotalea atypica]|uniref:DUF481 domain-containing protein n=1 Tax=Thalassotalea atypica TaxID=2054316 RepID=UPI0025724767|nr:DUF481 domain-containing protein [Thalassotalea atypica]